MKLEMNEEDAKKLHLIKTMHDLDSLEDALVWALRNVKVRRSSLDMMAFEMDLDTISSIPPIKGPQVNPDEPRSRGGRGWQGIEINLRRR